MSKFETKRVEAIHAREEVEQLFIKGIGVLDEFYSSLKGTTYECEFDTMIRYIEHFANGNSVGKKMKYLKNTKDNIAEYEFISKHLRVYAIQQPGKKIILYSGFKKKADSSDNIYAFRLVKKDYLEFLKQ